MSPCVRSAWAGAAAAACLLAAPRASAQEWTWSLSSEAASQYVWRGTVLDDGPVVQPSLRVERGGLSLSAWGSVSLRTSELREVDLDAGWSRTWGRATFGGNAALYALAHEPVTLEVQALASFDAPVRVGLLAARSPRGGGTYASLTLSRELDVPGRATLELAGSVGWASRHYASKTLGAEHATSADMGLSVTVSVPLGESVVLSPFVRWSRFMPGDARDVLGDPQEIVAGAGITLTR